MSIISLTAEASSAVFNTGIVIYIFSFGIPRDIASLLLIFPSGGISFEKGLNPPVKIKFGALLALWSSIPAKNLSGSYHSMIFELPGGKYLAELRTTIASEICTDSKLFLSQGDSIKTHKLLEINPLLKVNKVIIAAIRNFLEFLIKENIKRIKINPKGENTIGRNLLRK